MRHSEREIRIGTTTGAPQLEPIVPPRMAGQLAPEALAGDPSIPADRRAEDSEVIALRATVARLENMLDRYQVITEKLLNSVAENTGR